MYIYTVIKIIIILVYFILVSYFLGEHAVAQLIEALR
jgi:hypothetical protein